MSKYTAKLSEKYLDANACYDSYPIDVWGAGHSHSEQILVFGSEELARFIVDSINNCEDDVDFVSRITEDLE